MVTRVYRCGPGARRRLRWEAFGAIVCLGLGLKADADDKGHLADFLLDGAKWLADDATKIREACYARQRVRVARLARVIPAAR